jgi:cytoskeletal protein CcmA (bactofilin family)
VFNQKKPPPLKSLVAPGCEIEGHMRFSEGLRMDGRVKGDLLGLEGGPTILVISESAQVTGAVQADHIIVNGRVIGPVHARQMLELQPKAQITGDVTYLALEMHKGALVEGRLTPILERHQADEKPTLKLAANNG